MYGEIGGWGDGGMRARGVERERVIEIQASSDGQIEKGRER